MGAFPLLALWQSLPSIPILLAAFVAISILYALVLAIYRVTLHPLARFPGPKLTAVTGWYECFLDFFAGPGETFAFAIERMHERYGSIVRINPHEIHVSDPDFFDTLYAGGSARRDKYPPAAHVQGTPEGIFGTVDHQTHRKRRAAISGYFSKQSILQDQGIVDEKIELLCDVFSKAKREGKELNIRVPLLALGTDVFCQHTLGPRGCMDLLKDWDRAATWRASIIALLHWTPVVRQFSWVMPFAVELPMWIIKAISQELALVVSIFRDLRIQAAAAIAEHDSLEGEQKVRANVFHTILSSNLEAHDKEVKRMAQEGFSILSASGDTIARSMTAAMYHLHANPPVLKRLKEELKQAMPNPYAHVDLATLEALPWLTAVLKESLRIAALITTRAPLQAPTEWMRYQEWAIPPNTPVSMTLSSMALDAKTWPEPMRFIPERWMEENSEYKRNMGYFVPFHRGHRNCIGINLAWCQMYLTLAKLIRRFDFELYDVVRERDIDNYRDCFLGEPRDDSLGVRMKVVAEEAR
ncbi:cytochrome P450 [Lindgomyces ingoldianus]|uniref:Cytochrome P450 n=1 Tax=Lindgomyces ingoldianus TaxID=673940 RepID=A0ACB6QLJ9_9PLEO|nr:cytochrome P450 [Lindgomyces ingoldianus]KAF2467747.1 cytochrome P450 [Lindgomyces ingoldianus]